MKMGRGLPGSSPFELENGFPYFYVTEDGDMELSRNATIGGNLEVTGTINGTTFPTRSNKEGASPDPFVVTSDLAMNIYSGKAGLGCGGASHNRVAGWNCGDFR